jgi:hypothetical protein
MKTAKLTSVLATLSLVLFMSVASIANSAALKSGDLHKSADKSLNFSSSTENDYSYLRFDVTKFMNENEEADATVSNLNYLRFDVNDFLTENASEITELPAAHEFEYLRFDVDSFTGSNPVSTIELPVNEYDYLHFNVSDYVNTTNSVTYELPETE